MHSRKLVEDKGVSELYAEIWEILEVDEEHVYDIKGALEPQGDQSFKVKVDDHEYEVGPGHVRTSSWMSKQPDTTAYEVQRYLLKNSKKPKPDETYSLALPSEDQKIRPGDD